MNILPLCSAEAQARYLEQGNSLITYCPGNYMLALVITFFTTVSTLFVILFLLNLKT